MSFTFFDQRCFFSFTCLYIPELTKGWRPKLDGLKNGDSFKIWPCFVSMLDFLGVTPFFRKGTFLKDIYIYIICMIQKKLAIVSRSLLVFCSRKASYHSLVSESMLNRVVVEPAIWKLWESTWSHVPLKKIGENLGLLESPQFLGGSQESFHWNIGGALQVTNLVLMVWRAEWIRFTWIHMGHFLGGERLNGYRIQAT